MLMDYNIKDLQTTKDLLVSVELRHVIIEITEGLKTGKRKTAVWCVGVFMKTSRRTMRK